MKEQPDFTTRCHGIPCGVVIDSVLVVPPWRGPASACPSDLDYYGYSELEWHLIDRRGYSAEWLENILTPSETNQLEDEIYQQSKKGEYE